MPLFRKFIQEADATGQPARGTKCRATRREVKSRIETICSEAAFPSAADWLELVTTLSAEAREKTRIPCIATSGLVLREGRAVCQLMIDRSLPFVVAYNVSTDPDWP